MRKTWFITGITSGFGKEMTERVLERGDHVIGTARESKAIADLQNKYPEALTILLLDLTDTANIYKVVEKAFAQYRTIDIIVNNAGYGLFGITETLTSEQIQHELNTNLLGSVSIIHAAIPYLRKQNSGKIIQLSSVAGQTAHPGASLYHASKWGIEGFCESISKELAPFHISVTIVEPGGARTNFSKTSLQLSKGSDAYASLPAGQIREAFVNQAITPVGDPQKMVQQMIQAADQDDPPLRLTLGSDAYQTIHESLHDRIQKLENQEELAFQTDAE